MTTRKSKPKKPKARRMWASQQGGTVYPHKACFIDRTSATPVAVLDVSDEAALIEVVGDAILEQYVQCSDVNHAARAALTALGVLPKRRGK